MLQNKLEEQNAFYLAFQDLTVRFLATNFAITSSKLYFYMIDLNQPRTPPIKYRKDYRPSDYLITKTQLNFQLFDEYVLVTSELKIHRNPIYNNQPLVDLCLDGIQLQLVSIKVDNKILSEQDYVITKDQLVLSKVNKSFILTTEVKIYPARNTSLEGLYLSNGKFCTQCEAEGFRKITYYVDRPEIMSEFFVSIEADQSNFPLLLSNGNPTSSMNLENNRHIAHWHDPFPKPSYLFALVAGDLDCLQDKFITMSNRKVILKLFVDRGKLDQCRFAMDSLIEAMKWDEQRFGREYDLDLYMIVAVSDFNMGAMENKGLNIFNTAFVLANKKSATDSDFENVERVIAHEYFHNWTGNRITCRDWFQLSLKEGLTVFRDQKFSETMQSEVVERINQVKIIRSAQFAEDSGPMAHPIRPDSYIEMNNFYTVTVYNKGAEVIRMMHTLVGEDGFRKGMDLYFDRFDGQAVTCEDFIQSMESANGVDWTLFRNWYSQSGTPKLKAELKTVTKNSRKGLDLSSNTKIIISFSQTCPSANTNPKDCDNKPYMIPIRTSLLHQDGSLIEIKQTSKEKWQQEILLILTDYHQEFELEINVPAEAEDCSYIPSLLRNFSAPVKLEYDYSINQLTHLYAHDSDPFNRWDAGQTLMTRVILSENKTISQNELAGIGVAFKKLLNDSKLDNALKSLAIQLPSLSSLIGEVDSVDLDDLFLKHRQLKYFLARELQDQWLTIVNQYSNREKVNSGDRSLKNTALSYLMMADEAKHISLVAEHQNNASNMTDEIAALQIICRSELLSSAEFRTEQIDQFLKKWKNEDLVLDKWFTAQVLQDTPDVIENVKLLLSNECFSIFNPNKVRALIGSFAAGNIPQFHCATGSGYDFITQQVIQLNEVNPQMGARLVKQFSQWRKFDKKRQALIKDCLEQILTLQNLSPDIFEIASKSLNG